MNKNISDQLVEILVEAGIKRIYSVTGDSLNHVNAAVHRNGKIKWIHVQHEETAAFAAGAEAQLNGMACCAGSCGPGKPNAIHPEFVASVINELAAKDAIFTVDTGMCCVWAARYINGTGERKMQGFALYMGKMMLSGRMDEVFKIIPSNYKHLGEVLWFEN